MELSEIRKQIDAIDDQLVKLLCQRMALSAQVADYKKEHNLPIFVPAREEEILKKVETMTEPDLACHIRQLYTKLFEISRNYQSSRNEVI